MPERIQLKRTKGWRMPDNTVSVARPGKWGNPWAVSDELPVSLAVRAFSNMLKDPELRASVNYPSDDEIRAELGGKNLACWCREGEACHGDVLLELANSPADKEG